LAGLILQLLLWLVGLPGGSQEPYPEDHLARVDLLMAAPQAQDRRWRLTLYQSLTRLDSAPPQRVLPAWQLLATQGGDTGQANLILFCRRHGLPLPAVTVSEAGGSGLERSLALWGSGQLEACRSALSVGLATYPGDSRFRTNLDWLDMRLPSQLAADSTSRELAQAVLAARIAHP
jgi:hypothetical protein